MVRVAAAALALIAAVGLWLEAMIVHEAAGSTLGTLWILLRYFTTTTNAFVVLVFAVLALGRPPVVTPRIVAGTALSILLVGIVNAVLLRGIGRLFGPWRLDDVLVHAATPVLVPLFWLLATPKGHLRARDPFVWGLYPLAYLAYALGRGAWEGRYAYPFIDVARLGWARVGVTAGAIALGFIAVGGLWVAVDGAWPRDARRPEL